MGLQHRLNTSEDIALGGLKPTLQQADHRNRTPNEPRKLLLREADRPTPLTEVAVHRTDGTTTGTRTVKPRRTSGHLDDSTAPGCMWLVDPRDNEPLTPNAPYWQRLRRLRRDRGLSQPKLYRSVEDLSLDTIRALERDPSSAGDDQRRGRARYPSTETLEKLAAALDVDPATFPEYRLAKARELLDERAVGLDEALATLELSELLYGDPQAARDEAQRIAEDAAETPGERTPQTGEDDEAADSRGKQR